MNSAEVMKAICQGDALGAAGDRLHKLEQRLDALTSMLEDFEDKFQDLTMIHTDDLGVRRSMEVPELPLPNRYDGTPDELCGFICQCRVRFEIQPRIFASHQNRVGFIFSLLKGKALDWASALRDKGSPILQNSDSFIDALRRVFDTLGRKTLAVAALLKLQQGQNTVHQYALEFRTLAWDTEWNDSALSVFFYEGLNRQLKNLLVPRDPSDSLEELIHRCNMLDVHIRQRQLEKGQLYKNRE